LRLASLVQVVGAQSQKTPDPVRVQARNP
jgi:hypothetical protein